MTWCRPLPHLEAPVLSLLMLEAWIVILDLLKLSGLSHRMSYSLDKDTTVPRPQRQDRRKQS
eukprot:4664483-Amphidinium_carterae.1